MKKGIAALLAVLIMCCFNIAPDAAQAAADKPYAWTNLSSRVPAGAQLTDIAWAKVDGELTLSLAAGGRLLRVDGSGTVQTVAAPAGQTAAGLFSREDNPALWVVGGNKLRLYSADSGWSVALSIGGNDTALADVWASSAGTSGYAAANNGIYQFDLMFGTVAQKTSPAAGQGVQAVWASESAAATVYALCGGTVYKSNNGGGAWTAVAGATGLRAMCFRNGTSGWAAGGGGCIYTLGSNGAWQKKATGTTANLNAVAFDTTGSTGIAVGDAGAILYSSNGGETWSLIAGPAGVTSKLTLAAVMPDKAVYLAGEGPTLVTGQPTGPVSHTNKPKIVRMVTVQKDGDAPDYNSRWPSVSDNGRFVSFSSKDDELVSGDGYDTENLFLWDGTNRSNLMLDREPGGAPAHYSVDSGISSDSNWISLCSSSQTLAPGAKESSQSTGLLDVFLYNRGTKAISLVSANAALTAFRSPVPHGVSGDGRYVLYSGRSVMDGTYSCNALYLFDRVKGSTVSLENVVCGHEVTGSTAMSGDGSTVVYGTIDFHIVADPGGGTAAIVDGTKVYVRNVAKGTARLLFSRKISYSTQVDISFSLSRNGRYFAYRDFAGRVYLVDLTTNKSEIISVKPNGQPTTGLCWGSCVSANGRYVLFSSIAPDLVAGDTNGTYDVFLRDRKTGKTTRVSTNTAGEQSDNEYTGSSLLGYSNSMSSDGRFIAYESQATNLVSSPEPMNVTCIYWAELDVEPDVLPPAPAITKVAASPSSIACAGGKSTVTVSGSNLKNGIKVTAFAGSAATLITGTTAGSGTAQTVVLAFPANMSAVSGKTYTIKASMDGGATWGTATGQVTVAKFVLSEPSAPMAASASYNSIMVTWKAVAYATGYEVWRAATATGTYTAVGTAASSGFTNTSLATGTTYYYKVRSYRVSGTAKIVSGFTTAVSAKPVPAAPASVKAAQASGNSIRVTWGAVAGATKYEIWRSASSAGTYTPLSTTASAYYTDTGLTAGKYYYYKVRAYRLAGSAKVYGGFSAAVSAAGIQGRLPHRACWD